MLTTIRNKIRNLIQDNGLTMVDTFTYRTSSIFSLTETFSTISSISINGSATTSYTSDSDDNTVTITATLTENDVIIINYIYYKYTNTELNAYIKAALDFMSFNNYFYFEVLDTDIYPIPTLKEKSLIAAIVYILIEPEYSEYRTPSVTIRYPRKMTKEEKIEQLLHSFKMGSSYNDVILLVS